MMFKHTFNNDNPITTWSTQKLSLSVPEPMRGPTGDYQLPELSNRATSTILDPL